MKVLKWLAKNQFVTIFLITILVMLGINPAETAAFLIVCIVGSFIVALVSALLLLAVALSSNIQEWGRGYIPGNQIWKESMQDLKNMVR